MNKVLLIYTGGTIGMGVNPDTGALESLDIQHLIESMPELDLIQTDIDVFQISPPIDSSDMSPERWQQLIEIISSNYDKYDGFVIIHGTDTMAYTASALSFMLENLTKPIILTGSQLPIGQLRSDGKENLITSIELASQKHPDGKARVPEVCIYFSGRLLRGNRSTKIDADGFNAFETFNFPHLCDAGINFAFHDHHILKPRFNQPTLPHFKMEPGVIVLSLFPGLQETIIDRVLHLKEIRGIVLRTFGSGNAPRNENIMKLFKNATSRGVVIVNISQCIAGTVVMDRYDTGFQLMDAGIISGHDSTVEAAVTKMMYLLARYDNPELVRKWMNIPIAGEFTAN